VLCEAWPGASGWNKASSAPLTTEQAAAEQTTAASRTRELKNPPSPKLLRKLSRAGWRAGAE
ncbi:MAG: hypothetical protein DME82_12395, partial [Verrucomicrobia bacterium]